MLIDFGLRNDRASHSVAVIFHHLVPHFPWPKELKPRKKKGTAGPPSRRSLRLAEQARQEMLRQRKIAHGGHEVGDTHEDPLFIPSDEDQEMEVPPPPEAEVGSLLNPKYDSDYVEWNSWLMSPWGIPHLLLQRLQTQSFPPCLPPRLIFRLLPLKRRP
nr:uncharacterized protein LOC109166971 [Ipomoea trifida]